MSEPACSHMPAVTSRSPWQDVLSLLARCSNTRFSGCQTAGQPGISTLHPTQCGTTPERSRRTALAVFRYRCSRAAFAMRATPRALRPHHSNPKCFRCDFQARRDLGCVALCFSLTLKTFAELPQPAPHSFIRPHFQLPSTSSRQSTSVALRPTVSLCVRVAESHTTSPLSCAPCRPSMWLVAAAILPQLRFTGWSQGGTCTCF